MATFQPFPRLPLEIRIQIWGDSAVESRVIKVQKPRGWVVNSSPTPVPGITRACRESRRHCSYMKAFTVDGNPNYIWADFENDIIQMNCSFMVELLAGQRLEKNELRHLRLELIDDWGFDDSEWFFHDYHYKIRYFPKLQICEFLVNDDNIIINGYWGACPKNNVRMVYAKTGEWIDATTPGAYANYFDSNNGATRYFTRIDDDHFEDEVEERYEDMMATIKEALPRSELFGK